MTKLMYKLTLKLQGIFMISICTGKNDLMKASIDVPLCYEKKTNLLITIEMQIRIKKCSVRHITGGGSNGSLMRFRH